MLDTISYVQLYSCHEYKEKKRCPNCGSLNTKKNGFIYSRVISFRGKVKRKTQRFYCKSCLSSFTNVGKDKRTKSSIDFRRKIVRESVMHKSSLSEVASRNNISKTSILNWMDLEAYRLKLPAINSELCSGYLQLDGKEVKLRGKKRTILLATDSKTKQPLQYQISIREDKASTITFLSHFLRQNITKGL